MFLKYEAKNCREAIAGKQLNGSKSSDYVIKVHKLNYKAAWAEYILKAFEKFHFQNGNENVRLFSLVMEIFKQFPIDSWALEHQTKLLTLSSILVGFFVVVVKFRL